MAAKPKPTSEEEVCQLIMAREEEMKRRGIVVVDELCGGSVRYYPPDQQRGPFKEGYDLQYCRSLADLAIDFYNKKRSKEYRVAEVVEVYGIPNAFCYILEVEFTGHPPDDNANLLTFNSIIDCYVDGRAPKVFGVSIRGVDPPLS